MKLTFTFTQIINYMHKTHIWLTSWESPTNSGEAQQLLNISQNHGKKSISYIISSVTRQCDYKHQNEDLSLLGCYAI